MKLSYVAAWSAAAALGLGLLVGASAVGPGLPDGGSASGSGGAVSAAAGTGSADADATLSETDAIRLVSEETEAAQGGEAGDKNRVRRGVLRRLEHGEFVVLTRDGHRTFHIQRGTVTAVSTTSVTVKSADGFTEKWTINGDTKIRKQQGDIPASAIKTGDWVRAVGPENGDDATARRIRVRG